jgi:hypothetical protein
MKDLPDLHAIFMHNKEVYAQQIPTWYGIETPVPPYLSWDAITVISNHPIPKTARWMRLPITIMPSQWFVDPCEFFITGVIVFI